MRSYLVAVSFLAGVGSMQALGAAPTLTGKLPATERPDIEVTKTNPPKATTYGL